MNGGYKCLVGAYERLSREDEHSDESTSIESQKMIIESFVKFNEMELVGHYSDDGFTGSNFKRPGFNRLKADIEAGMVNCVVVKDLSRLGRELYETGNYIEAYFLRKGVRFIAINDGYDSNVGDEMLGIRLSVNDLYLRDTSKKIRSTFDAKRKKGDYIGSLAKYGYQKNPHNPKQLIIDEAAAKIVRQIYTWLASGAGTSIVAHRLTQMKVPIPSIYKNENRSFNQKQLNDGNGIWRPQTIKALASDKMYLGHMVQGRWKKLSYNSKRLIELPERDWIVVENTHEAIIDDNLFNQVQIELNKKQKYRAKKESKHLLQGLLKCKECGHNISIYQKKNKHGITYTTECNYYSKYSKYHLCTSHRLNYSKLEMDVLKYFQELGLQLLQDDNHELMDESMLIKQNKKVLLQQQEVTINQQINKTQAILTNLYEDRLNKIISTSQYKNMAQKYEGLINDYQIKKHELVCQLQQLETINQLALYEECLQTWKDFVLFNHPTNELFYQLIDKIEIDKDKQVEVFFKEFND